MFGRPIQHRPETLPPVLIINSEQERRMQKHLLYSGIPIILHLISMRYLFSLCFFSPLPPEKNDNKQTNKHDPNKQTNKQTTETIKIDPIWTRQVCCWCFKDGFRENNFVSKLFFSISSWLPQNLFPGNSWKGRNITCQGRPTSWTY